MSKLSKKASLINIRVTIATQWWRHTFDMSPIFSTTRPNIRLLKRRYVPFRLQGLPHWKFKPFCVCTGRPWLRSSLIIVLPPLSLPHNFFFALMRTFLLWKSKKLFSCPGKPWEHLLRRLFRWNVPFWSSRPFSLQSAVCVLLRKF